MVQAHRRTRALVSLAALLVAGLALVWNPAPAAAQDYFGQNKVQYQTFDFRILRTQHFDIYYYPAESLATVDEARMAERWYARHSRVFSHTFQRKPIVLYANHPDFQQTNLTSGFISQGTGGFTEPLRDRVAMPLTGVYAENDHVLGHELVHVFQFDIAASGRAGGIAGLNRLPLWLIEGMAEYLSLGRDDPNTAMWLRDATLRKDIPTIKKLNSDPRYFPYRYGQALWAFIGGTWGDEMVNAVYRESLRAGWENALRRVLHMTGDTLSARWIASIRSQYEPLMQGRQTPADVGSRILKPSSKYGDMDVSPAVSPDGRYVAFFTSRGLFNIDLYVADVETGEIVKKLTGPNNSPHFDAIEFINSSGSWSPDGKKFAFVTQYQGNDVVSILDVDSRNVERKIEVKGVGEMTSLSWGPRDEIVVSGSRGGISDLYLVNATSGQMQQLTNDKFADLQPSWSPDGRTIAFVTDQGPGTSFDTLTYAPMHLALFDVASGQTRLLDPIPQARQINPQWSPDGKDVYFIADPGGFADVFRLSVSDGALFRVTNIATAISGITALSPALSVARQSGRLVFSVFTNQGNELHRMEPEQARGTPLNAPTTALGPGGILPPASAQGQGIVAVNLADATVGLPPTNPDFQHRSYHPSLGIEYIGSPGVGVSFGGPFGTQVGGGIQAAFTDMLDIHVLGLTLLQNGSNIRDFGGQAYYLNQRRRLNWFGSVSHVPYLSGLFGVIDTTLTTGSGDIPAQILEQDLFRTYQDQASIGALYPLSQAYRFELSGGITHVGFGIERDRVLFINGIAQDQEVLHEDGPPGINFGSATLAFVGDYSSFGFTSPVAGARFRLEASPYFGGISMTTALADYRRYFLVRPVTFAFRALHYGRDGHDADNDSLLGPLYVGQDWFVRGYNPNSVVNDCVSLAVGGCPELERLIGSKIAVASFEVRIPLFGTEQYGLINFPYLPTEIAPFIDAGAAWTSSKPLEFAFKENTTDRVPVFSTGVSGRFNVLGALVVEVYWAHAFQRPNHSSVWGFQLSPGW